MPLQFIIGNSGSGKSYTVFQSVIQEAREHPEQRFLCDRAGTVYHADAKNTGRNASGRRNPEY